MKRLTICALLLGCGASQSDAPEDTTPAPKTGEPVAQAAAEPADAPPPKLETPLERRLFPQKFSASSHLENDWNKFQENYLATYLGDDNPVTSWTEGKSDVGLGERVMVEHTPLEDATKLRLEIRNGYQKTPRLFTRNARAKEISLKLLPGGSISKHTLTDSEGWQTVVAEQPEGPLKGYEIQFDSVYKGTHYEDLVVSDIQTYVTSRTPDNPSYEASKQARLLEWVASRKQAAQTFKDAAKGSIPVAPSYKAKKGTQRKYICDQGICPLPFKRAGKAWKGGAEFFASLEAAASEKFSGWKELRISTTDDRKIPQADAFTVAGPWSEHDLIYEDDYPVIALPIPNLLGFLNAKQLKRVGVETDSLEASAVLKRKAPGCKSKGRGKNYFFTPDTEGPLRELLVVTCGTYEDREGYTPGSHWQVQRYGEDGHLSHLFNFYSAYEYRWETKHGAPFLKQVARVSTGGANDTLFEAN